MTNKFNVGDKVCFSPNCDSYYRIPKEAREWSFTIWSAHPKEDLDYLRHSYILQDPEGCLWTAVESELCAVKQNDK